jgi:2'-5' RNA ligase
LQDFGFFSPRVIFVSVQSNEKLFKLHDELSLHAKTRLRLFNETEDLRGFHPHVTIAFRDLKRRHFEQLMPVFQQRTFSATFPYAGFSLLKLDKTWKEHYSFTLLPQ